MKLFRSLSPFLGAFALGVDAQTAYDCPTAGDPATILAVSPSSGATTVRVPVVTDADDLCSLVRRDASTGGRRVAVARSYAARNAWEVSAGLLSNAERSGLVVDCTTGGTTTCDVTLPPLELGTGQEYVLESRSRAALSPDAAAARFLEQATFGPTREAVDALAANDNDFEAWVAEQMGGDVGVSSLREFYRKRTNPKYEFPWVVGAVGSGPCELHSRWRTYAITSRDMLSDRKVEINKYLTITEEEGVAGYVWRVDGQFRTVTDEHPVDFDGEPLALGAHYRIEFRNGKTHTGNCVGCELYVTAPDAEDFVTIANPAVIISAAETALSLDVIALPDYKSSDLPSIEDSASYPLFARWIKPDENALLNTTSLEGSAACEGLDDGRMPVEWDGEADGAPGVTQSGAYGSIFAKSTDIVTGQEVVFAYDRHLTLYENTVEKPLADGGGALVIETANPASGGQVLCHNVKRNFYNAEGCVLSTLPTACSPEEDPTEVIVLNDANLAAIRASTGRLLYAVSGLALDDAFDPTTGFNAPCAVIRENQWSRWIKDPTDAACDNVASIGNATAKIYQDFIDQHGISELNFDVVDADRIHRLCDPDDRGKTYLGKVRASNGSCWRHVHLAELDVYDLTDADESLYTVEGNRVAIDGGMASFYANISQSFEVVGRFGDHVDLSDGPLPAPLNDPDVQEAYKTLEYNMEELPVLMCGSPGEIASDPWEGDNGFEAVLPENSGWRSMSRPELSLQRHTIWTHFALEAEDQLRMKMAWTLSQIVAVGIQGESADDDYEDTEHYLAFYDIFVRNAFGNYKDVMREFSFNAIMANWLSFKDNRSLQYNIDNSGKEDFPDENFAREIMQLFSVGLVKLNMDGSVRYQANGNPEDTYSIEDIQNYARAWTGFDERDDRGGAATGKRGFSSWTLDPMKIRADRRDHFPKSDLANGFVGDRIARCQDLPKQHALRKGATYQLLGGTGSPELHDDPDWVYENPDFLHLEVDPASPLYATLCEAVDGECTLPARVELISNLDYSAFTSNTEYKADTIRVVKMKVGSTLIWYEYIRQPCVEHSFYRNAKRVTKDNIASKLVQNAAMCADPLLEAATPMCSEPGWDAPDANKNGLIYCHYQGERTTFASADAICRENGLEQGYPWTIKQWRAGPCQYGISNKLFRSWADDACGLKVKVELGSGDIAIVHEPGMDRSGTTAAVETFVSEDTLNFFRVPWEGGVSPTESDCISMPSCSVHGANYCICDATTMESMVYSTATEVTEGIDQLMEELHIGAADPASFDTTTYTSLECSIPGVTVYVETGTCASLDTNSIFAFVWNSRPTFLRNARSVVSIPDLTEDFAFRNPVAFISLSDPEKRDAYHETEAVLDSLFYHPSHPPFLAVRIIQRFGISNPSPGMVERVASAYKAGAYGTFGSGKYGDLGVMVAAILLDGESRAPVLDADPGHGHLREPLVKVLSFFRSMGLHYETPFLFPTLHGMEQRIGQGSFDSPSVFSFFLPEFTPPGGVQTAGLVAPEAQVLRGDGILFLLDAYYGTTKFGIVECHKSASFGDWKSFKWSCPSTEGDASLSPARLSYAPRSTVSVDAVLDELDILLTSSRLKGSANRALIKSIVEPIVAVDVSKAVRVAQQLMLSTPEYHATSLPRKQDSARVLTGYTERHKAPYKAVVVFMMRGGCDSWNMLVPVDQCATSDAYGEYKEARGEAHAIPKANLINITASGQECAKYGVNENFPLLADLYNEGEGIFFANAGVLPLPVTRDDDWRGSSGFRPFAHNTMQESYYNGDVFQTVPGTGVMGRILDVLRQGGLQTSANNVDSGLSMLSGDAVFNNPVYTVSTKALNTLNKYPTIDNLIDVVKQLNGYGNVDNSLMGEYWSSRVAASLFEHEQMHEIAAIPEFEVDDYPVTDVKISSSFKAIAGYMKSREYRKVNRDVFVLSQGSYDMHNADNLAENFADANWALTDFVAELKSQGLWENTVIVSGSDFGRTMNTNSNGGTDHAWGGNYFIAGGSVAGGKIMGTYPTPLGPESDHWLKRGRWIPTTPWDAVFNAVAQWLGVHDDADLDRVLPNRGSFDACSLFTDRDLFTDGVCECVADGESQRTVCDDVTYAPTVAPTESPSYPPSGNPTTSPTRSPTKSPSETPTGSPSFNPTTELPDDGWLVNNLFSPVDAISVFGCETQGAVHRIFDGTTNRYSCDRTNFKDVPQGFIVSPENGQMSIVKALRIYAPSTCYNCDILSYVMEGRTNATLPWVQTHAGDLPWKSIPASDLGRNAQMQSINSTYASGDTNLIFTEVRFHGHGEPYLEYKLSFTTRNPEKNLGFAAIELPGMQMPPEPSISPTRSPSSSPTASPSTGPTVSPTKSPSDSPTAGPTGFPTADLPDNGWLVANILEDSYATGFGCRSSGKPWKLLDKKTDKYNCDRTDLHNVSTGVLFVPNHGQRTIPKGIRVYSGNNCKMCDPMSYLLEGRLGAADPWVEIATDELGWESPPLRNEPGLVINSTYESGDNNRFYSELQFHTHSDEYLEYKLTFGPTRDPISNTLYVGEVEIPGMLMPPDPTTSPTRSPSTSPTASPSHEPTVSPTKSPSLSPTTSPTGSPTAELPHDGWLVANIFLDSSVSLFGCANTGTGSSVKIGDGTTARYNCDRTGLHHLETGIIITPDHGKSSIVKGLRLYPGNDCKNCDPTGFILEGRVDDASPWVIVREGDFPGVADGLDRNEQGLPIESTYTSGDTNHTFTQVSFPSNSDAFFEYKVSFTGTKGPGNNKLRFAELEAHGMLLPPEPSVSPTSTPSLSPTTGTPTTSPSPPPSTSPTSAPSASPSTAPTGNPTAELPAGGTLVANILAANSFSTFGCVHTGSPWKTSDSTTNKYVCDRTGLHNVTTGIIANSTTGKLTIPKELRIYGSNGCYGCDPIIYLLEGRVDAASAWVEVASGDLPWKYIQPWSDVGRNSQGLDIVSTYESPDPNLEYTSVHYHSQNAAYLDYKLTFGPTRKATKNSLQFAEIEIAGWMAP